MTFLKFDVESIRDFVKVFDGANNSAPLLGTYSGPTFPENITSSTNYLFVSFDSDYSVTEKGFSVKYTAANLNGKLLVAVKLVTCSQPVVCLRVYVFKGQCFRIFGYDNVTCSGENDTFLIFYSHASAEVVQR